MKYKDYHPPNLTSYPQVTNRYPQTIIEHVEFKERK